MKRRPPVAEFALIAIAGVWGLTFVVVQDAIALIPVPAFLAYRFIPAAAFVAVGFSKELKRLSWKGWRAGAVMGVFLTGGYVLQTLGLERTSAANAGFITGLWVVLTPVFGALFFSQRAGAPVWSAAGLSAVGLLLLSGAGAQGSHVLGDSLVFLCSISFTLHIFATDRSVNEHAVGALVVVQLAVCGLFNLALAAATGEIPLPRTSSVWGALGLTSVVASALGFFVQTYAQRHASPARTALILASEPAFAGLFAYLLAGEKFTSAGWFGAALILGSIAFVELRAGRADEMGRRPLPEYD